LDFWEKIGEGIGKTRKEAQCQAADTSLRNLAGELMIDPPFFLCSVGVANVQRNWGGGGIFVVTFHFGYILYLMIGHG